MHSGLFFIGNSLDLLDGELCVFLLQLSEPLFLLLLLLAQLVLGLQLPRLGEAHLGQIALSLQRQALHLCGQLLLLLPLLGLPLLLAPLLPREAVEEEVGLRGGRRVCAARGGGGGCEEAARDGDGEVEHGLVAHAGGPAVVACDGGGDDAAEHRVDEGGQLAGRGLVLAVGRQPDLLEAPVLLGLHALQQLDERLVGVLLLQRLEAGHLLPEGLEECAGVEARGGRLGAPHLQEKIAQRVRQGPLSRGRGEAPEDAGERGVRQQVGLHEGGVDDVLHDGVEEARVAEVLQPPRAPLEARPGGQPLLDVGGGEQEEGGGGGALLALLLLVLVLLLLLVARLVALLRGAAAGVLVVGGRQLGEGAHDEVAGEAQDVHGVLRGQRAAAARVQGHLPGALVAPHGARRDVEGQRVLREAAGVLEGVVGGGVEAAAQVAAEEAEPDAAVGLVLVGELVDVAQQGGRGLLGGGHALMHARIARDEQRVVAGAVAAVEGAQDDLGGDGHDVGARVLGILLEKN